MAAVAYSDVIAGVAVVTPVVHSDERGLFVETYRKEWITGAREMVQANRGDRQAGSLVGLHYHLHQADYWYVPFGGARVVLHDLRRGSPTEAATLMLDLGRVDTADTEPIDARSDSVRSDSARSAAEASNPHRGVYIPSGVAHGFAALSDMTITYLVDGYYNPTDELGVAWDDPTIGADWGVAQPILSERDQANPQRADIPAHLMPVFEMPQFDVAGLGVAGLEKPG